MDGDISKEELEENHSREEIKEGLDEIKAMGTQNIKGAWTVVLILWILAMIIAFVYQFVCQMS